MRRTETPLLTPEALRHLRKRLKLTQADMARRINVTLRAVENYEQPVGKKNHRQIPNKLSVMLLRWERDGLPY
jgi:DNA-binding transcriptional regulator YiaG